MEDKDRGTFRSDLDPGTAYDGRFRHFFGADQLEGFARRLPVLNRILPLEVYILLAGILAIGGTLALRFIDQNAQQISVIGAKGNQDEKDNPSPIDELIRSRITYNTRAEVCFRTGRCDDPEAAEIWTKMREVGYVDGLILTIPEDSGGSPATITLPESARLLMMPGSCGLSDRNTLAGVLQGTEVPISQRYEVKKANGETEGIYLLIHPAAFPKDSKPIPTWMSTKPWDC